jgi:hypothetical protein
VALRYVPVLSGPFICDGHYAFERNLRLTTHIAPLEPTNVSKLLAKGTVFDVECRDSSTGDAAFLQVTGNVKGATLSDLNDTFFLNQLLSPTGRFSFYGPPTSVKLISSQQKDDYRILDISFSTISQATQTEIPRRARLAATIPAGASQAVMLIASSSAIRWKKGSSITIASVIESFRAIPAPQSGLRLRGKERGRGLELE